jgi:hypothetical protein
MVDELRRLKAAEWKHGYDFWGAFQIQMLVASFVTTQVAPSWRYH